MEEEQIINPGCEPQINKDPRDYKAEEILGDILSENIDYSKVKNGVIFDIEVIMRYIERVGVEKFKSRQWSIAYAQDIMAEETGRILTTTKNQAAMDNCVFQARAFYGQVLNFIETGEWVEFSSIFKFWEYSLQYGAYISQGANAAVGAGFALESQIPSYKYFLTDHGKEFDMDREFARSSKNLEAPEIVEGAKKYSSLRYAQMNSKNIETIAKLCILNFGALGGYYYTGMRFDKNSKNIFELDGNKPGSGHCNHFGGKITIDDAFGLIVWSKDSYGNWNGRDKTNGFLGHTQKTLDANMYFDWYTLIDKDNLLGGYTENEIKAAKKIVLELRAKQVTDFFFRWQKNGELYHVEFDGGFTYETASGSAFKKLTLESPFNHKSPLWGMTEANWEKIKPALIIK